MKYDKAQVEKAMQLLKNPNDGVAYQGCFMLVKIFEVQPELLTELEKILVERFCIPVYEKVESNLGFDSDFQNQSKKAS